MPKSGGDSYDERLAAFKQKYQDPIDAENQRKLHEAALLAKAKQGTVTDTPPNPAAVAEARRVRAARDLQYRRDMNLGEKARKSYEAKGGYRNRNTNGSERLEEGDTDARH